MFELRIHFKGIKKPIILTLDTKRQLNEFYEMIQTNDIVKYGQLIFKREDFVYATIEVEEI